LKDQDQHLHEVVSNGNLDQQAGTAPKRMFVEPEISQPADVLEATTFFQAVDSGATN
jgi:hypothetical protein